MYNSYFNCLSCSDNLNEMKLNYTKNSDNQMASFDLVNVDETCYTDKMKCMLDFYPVEGTNSVKKGEKRTFEFTKKCHTCPWIFKSMSDNLLKTENDEVVNSNENMCAIDCNSDQVKQDIMNYFNSSEPYKVMKHIYQSVPVKSGYNINNNNHNNACNVIFNYEVANNIVTDRKEFKFNNKCKVNWKEQL